MPQNRFYIDVCLQEGQTVTFTGDPHHYFRKVMRGKPGDTIDVINGKGVLAQATVDVISKESFDAIINNLSFSAPSPFTLTLAIAFLKPAHLEYALEKATELGATGFILFPAIQSEKKEISETYLKRLHAIIESATKQCGRLYLPTIMVMSKFEPSNAYFGDFDGKSLETVPKDVTFIVGPEPGFTEKERAEFLRRDCIPILLHPNTLRAETAVVAATALLFKKLG